jgi:hypothetical protein
MRVAVFMIDILTIAFMDATVTLHIAPELYYAQRDASLLSQYRHSSHILSCSLSYTPSDC